MHSNLLFHTGKIIEPLSLAIVVFCVKFNLIQAKKNTSPVGSLFNSNKRELMYIGGDINILLQ